LPTSNLFTVLGFLRLQGMADLLFTAVNVTAISGVKFSSFKRHKTKNNCYTIFSITGCPAFQHSANIFSAKLAYINALSSLLVTY